MSEKYPGYNAGDTFWDEHHRSQGLMTNREFFTSNAKGGFYEGLEWDENKKDWVPNAETRQRNAEREQREKANNCQHCGKPHNYCWCDSPCSDEGY